MKTNSVGVVIPTYNCREFLSDCLESVLSQSNPPAQIVVCDDCSQDRTQEVILKYQGKYPDIIEAILHDKNIGIPKNFNSGLKKINTDFVSIVSGDDFWHKDKLKFELEALNEKTECRWAYSNSCLVDKEGNLISLFRREHDGAEGRIVFEILTHEMTLRNWTIEKGLLEDIGFFDESLEIFEDWDFKIRLAANSSVVHVDHNSVFYRRHGKGASSYPGNIYYDNLRKIFIKQKPLIEKLPKEKKLFVIKKQRKDMLVHIDRFLKSSHNVPLLGKLKYHIIKGYISLLAV